MRRSLLALVLLAGAIPAAVVARRAALAARAEYAELHPTRGRVALPADAAALGLRPVAFVADGAILRGWWAPARRGAAVALLHGSGSDRRAMLGEARALVAGGYGVLLFDWPGHGESAGRVEMGRSERRALGAAVALMARQPGVDPRRLGAVGFSLGGYVLATAAGDDPRLRALIVAGTPTDLDAQTSFEYRHEGTAAGWGARLGQRLGGRRPGGAGEPIAVVGRIAPRALLIVHGADDPVVPVAMARALHAAAGPTSRLWVIPGAGHGDYARAAPDYAARLRAFFDTALAPAAVTR